MGTPTATATVEVDNDMFELQLAAGNKLNIYTTLAGNLAYNFIPAEVDTTPRILLIEKYRLSTYLSQYGAGRVIETFSLLPGEKTTISLRTFKSTEEKATSASSILDSYTEETAEEFESSVMSEQSSTEATSKSFEYHAEAEAKASWGFGSASVSGGVAGSTDSSREEFAKNVENATSKQAATASAQRDVEVNTTSEFSTSTEDENSITREIQNINVGRTLNTTFRQMNQLFYTILHLVDVRVAYFAGSGATKEEVPLSKLDYLVDKYIVDTDGRREAVKEAVLAQVKEVKDYADQKVPFVEPVTNDTGETEYWRVKRKLVSEFSDDATGASFKVPGVILNVNDNVMRTDGVIAESLLGAADALDPYSRGLQDEKVRARVLENDLLALDLDLERSRQAILANKDAEAAAIYAQLYGAPTDETDTEDDPE